MNTKIYEYFIQVAECKNITKAAEQCFISQPALTQHIKKLEESLSFRLFERSKNQWFPTKQGEIFLTTARRMLQIEKEIYEKIELFKQIKSPTYRIFVDHHLRNVFIERILPEFSRQYPDLRISLISGDTDSAVEYIENNYIDVAVIPIFKELPAMVDYIPIDQNEYLLILPPDHPYGMKLTIPRIDLQQLKDETFIMNQTFSLFSSMQQQILERFGVTPKETLYAHSMHQLCVW